jgi:hypothetical protein
LLEVHYRIPPSVCRQGLANALSIYLRHDCRQKVHFYSTKEVVEAGK